MSNRSGRATATVAAVLVAAVFVFHAVAAEPSVGPVATQAAEAPAQRSDSALQHAVEWTLALDPLALTVLFLVFATVVGALLKGRSKDRCYKRMDRFPATLVLDDREVAGRLKVSHAGLEVACFAGTPGPVGKRIGFLLPKAEWTRLRAIVRVPDELDPDLRRRRDRMIDRVRRPGALRRFGRGCSNLAGSFTDAFNELFALLVGRLNTQLAKIQAQQKYVGRVEEEVAGLLPNASYDAILEGLRGKPVEIELKIAGQPPRIAAFLDDYTAANVSLFDADIAAGPGSVTIEERDGRKWVRNTAAHAILLPWLDGTELPPGQERVLEAEPPEDTGGFVMRKADVVFSRANAVVRYQLAQDAADTPQSMG